MTESIDEAVDRCSEITKRAKIPASGGSKTCFTLVNPQKVSVKSIKIDGCVISDRRKRCDHAFEAIDTRLVIYVELKGTHIREAVEQLAATLKHLASVHDQHERVCVIVPSRVPPGAGVQQIKSQFARVHGCVLHVKNGRVAADISKPADSKGFIR